MVILVHCPRSSFGTYGNALSVTRPLISDCSPQLFTTSLLLQINFFDHTAIVLSSDSKSVSYVNKDGSRSHHDLNSIMSDNRPDIAKRLKYTKDILSQLISGAVKGQ